jgi:hypothetical protein
LQGFPVSLVTAAFDSAGVIIAVIGLPVSVEVVVLVGGGAVSGVFADQVADGIAFKAVGDFGIAAGGKEDIRQDGILIAPNLFALQSAVIIIFLK